MSNPIKQLAISIKTFQRDESLFKLVKSIRGELPHAPIYIADDGDMTGAKNKFYSDLSNQGHQIYTMPFDSGLSAGRNLLLDNIKEQYFLNCDDDFIIRDTKMFLQIIRLLRDTPELLLVGGMTVELSGEVRAFAIDFDIGAGILKQRFAYNQMKISENIRYMYADMVSNFFIGKTELMRKIRWDDNFKIGYEHPDFAMRVLNKYKLAFSPDLTVWHSRNRKDKKYKKFRYGNKRIKGFKEMFYKKHNIEKGYYPAGGEW